MNLIIGVCVFLLIGFSCDNGNDQIEPVSTLELRLAKEGWRGGGGLRDLPDQAIKRIDRDRTTVRIPAKDEDMPTLIRNSWVVVHRVEIPRERKDKITLFFEPSSTKRLVFETADLDLAVQQMKKSTEEEIAISISYQPDGAAAEKLLLVQRRIELMRGDRVIWTGYLNNAFGTYVLKKVEKNGNK